MKFSLTTQINTVTDEIAQRERVYARLVQQRKMRQAEADYKIAAMQAVLSTLLWLGEHEVEIKTILAERKSNERA